MACADIGTLPTPNACRAPGGTARIRRSLFCIGCGEKNAQAGKPGAVDVQVVQVEQRDVPIYGEWIGTLDGLVNADVRAQVTGYLLRQAYAKGSYVKKASYSFRSTHGPFRQRLIRRRHS